MALETEDPHRQIDKPLTSSIARTSLSLKRYLSRLSGLFAARLLGPGALEHPSVRQALWRSGIAAQPKGFYSSLVDPRDIKESSTYTCAGVDFQPDTQRQFISDTLPRFYTEFSGLPKHKVAGWDASPCFVRSNDAFQNLDAIAYWAMIRSHRPSQIIEIGSGYSTLLAAEAIGRNGKGRVLTIDPYPRSFVRNNDLPIDLLPVEVQVADPGIFRALRADDVLFIDSSHVVRVGGDVTHMLLEIVPQLAPGVLVHIHDIYMPFDYPRRIVDERNTYWTEQYLLHAYFSQNVVDRVLFGVRYSLTHLRGELQRIVSETEMNGASLWFRRGKGGISQVLALDSGPCL